LAGIGKAVVKKLAQQGINVVMVALDEPLLTQSTQEMQAEFKSLSFVKVFADRATCYHSN
jgi:NADP-dependent 3-hydroxy acid dehydrogenase YdfG